MKLEGVFGLYHIIYFVISMGLTIGGLILIKKKVHKDETIKLILRITSIVLLAFAITNRISTTYYHIYTLKDWNSWWYVLPNSLCSICSFILPITVLISTKKDNPVFHFVIYLAFLGDLVTAFYPDFLDKQAFALLNSWTGVMHHSICLFLVLLLVVEGYLTPAIKKVYIAPIGYMCVIVFGLLNISIFGVSDSMNINNPLISSLKVLTSWYMIGILFTIFVLLVAVGYEHYHRHHKAISNTKKKK